MEKDKIISKVKLWLTRDRSASAFLYVFIPVIITIYSGAAVLYWFTDFTDMRVLSIRSDWSPMKPVTSLSFFVTGLSMLFHAQRKIRARDVATGVVLGLVLFIIAAFAFNNEALNIFPPFEEATYVHYALGSGVPSWATVLLFFIFWASFFQEDKTAPGTIMVGLGLVITFGYLLNIPILWFYFPEVSAGVPLTTALIFLIQGCWLIPWGSFYRQCKETFQIYKILSIFHLDKL